MESMSIFESVSTFAADWGPRALAAVVLTAVGLLLAGAAGRGVLKLSTHSARVDKTLLPLLSTLVKWSIIVVTAIAVLDTFGIQTASILAFLGAAGLAVGLALKDTVADVAAGMVLLVLRPFDVGDVIDIGGTTGTAEALGLFETRLRTLDGVPLVVRNSQVRSREIRNFTRAQTRRFELRVGLAYPDDVSQAIEAVTGLLGNEPRVLTDPAPVVVVESLGEHQVTVLIRGWTQPSDLLLTQSDLLRAIRGAFDALGFEAPMPRRDLRVNQPRSN